MQGFGAQTSLFAESMLFLHRRCAFVRGRRDGERGRAREEIQSSILFITFIYLPRPASQEGSKFVSSVRFSLEYLIPFAQGKGRDRERAKGQDGAQVTILFITFIYLLRGHRQTVGEGSRGVRLLQSNPFVLLGRLSFVSLCFLGFTFAYITFFHNRFLPDLTLLLCLRSLLNSILCFLLSFTVFHYP